MLIEDPRNQHSTVHSSRSTSFPSFRVTVISEPTMSSTTLTEHHFPISTQTCRLHSLLHQTPKGELNSLHTNHDFTSSLRDSQTGIAMSSSETKRTSYISTYRHALPSGVARSPTAFVPTHTRQRKTD